LLDNGDDILREAKKTRKELRDSHEVVDSKLEIDSLKASPVVSDKVDCAD
jgi:uncharacterized ferritin-like protein (DUF455 family)